MKIRWTQLTLIALMALLTVIGCASTGDAKAVNAKATEAVPAPAPAPVATATAEEPAAEKLLFSPSVIWHPEVKLLDTEGAGKLYQVADQLVCVMEGTPEEMGYQQGRLLAKQATHMIKDGYMQKALWGRGYTPEYVNAQSDRMEKFFPPEYIAEMKGVVKGLNAGGFADATYEDVRLGVTQAEILHYGPNSPPECSNFACWGRWTTDGRLLHGRNLDWNIHGQAQDDAVILVWRPKGGTPFMMIGWAGGVGSVTGMSSQGITLGEMTSTTPNSTFDGMPLFLIMRRILEKAKNLDEAVAIMEKGPRTTGWNFVIGDGKARDARALEVDAKSVEAYAPMDPNETEATGGWAMPDAVRRTNHPIGREKLMGLIEIYAPKMNLQITTIEEGLPLLKTQNTWQRYDWIGKQIESYEGGVDVRECLQILTNPPVGNLGMLHSCVLDPANQVAYIAIAGTNPPVTAGKRPYVRIDLSQWFK